VTVIQASICDINGTKTIILVSDRMVTYRRSYKAETTSKKIYNIGKFAVGFSGDLAEIVRIKDKLEEKKSYTDFGDFTKEISKIVKEENIRKEEQYIQKELLLSRDDFITYIKNSVGKISEGRINFVYNKLEEIRIESRTLAVGFCKKEPQIYYIDEMGEIFNWSGLFHCSIGSGSPLSEIYYDIRVYDPSCSLYDGLYNAYCAKRTAETHLGVGTHTDIMILTLNSDPDLIEHGTKKMKLLEKTYNNERTKIEKLFDESVIEVQKNFNNGNNKDDKSKEDENKDDSEEKK
jgi:20S proteasome alpha/beta subunit